MLLGMAVGGALVAHYELRFVVMLVPLAFVPFSAAGVFAAPIVFAGIRARPWKSGAGQAGPRDGQASL